MPGAKRKFQKSSSSSVSKKKKIDKQTHRLGKGQKRGRKKETGVKYAIRRTNNLTGPRKRNNNVKKNYPEKGRIVEVTPSTQGSNKPDLRSCKILKKEKTHNVKTFKVKLGSSSPPAGKASLARKSSHAADPVGKTLSKESAEPAQNITFVSLDVLEDSNKYKTKFRKPTNDWDLKNIQKMLKSISSYHRRFLSKKKDASNVQKPSTSRQEAKHHAKGSKHCKSFLIKKRRAVKNLPKLEVERSSRETLLTLCPSADGDSITDPEDRDDELEESLPESYIDLWPSFSQKYPPEENIAKIDGKYIRSLLHIAKREEKETQREKHSENQATKAEQTGKITGKAFFENKKRKKKERAAKKNLENRSKTRERKAQQPAEPEATDEGKKKTPEKDQGNVTRLVRDMTKSEVQVKNKKTKANTKSGRELKLQAEKVTHSRPEIAGAGKKRKARSNALKKEDDEYIEIPFPCEVSKGEDVKELWRRDSRKESLNSLSSHSSCTVAAVVAEEVYDPTNLGIDSYNTLKKIVQEEVHRISKKYIQENAGEKTQGNLVEKFKAPKPEGEETKDKLHGQPKVPISENFNGLVDSETSELDMIVRKRIEQAEKEQKHAYSPPQPPTQENFQQLKAQIKSLAKEKGVNGKVPSEIIKNWSILHRLEKAFLALGTPTIQNKNLKEPARARGMTTNKTTILPEKRVATERVTKISLEKPNYDATRPRKQFANVGETLERKKKKVENPTDKDSVTTFVCREVSTRTLCDESLHCRKIPQPKSRGAMDRVKVPIKTNVIYFNSPRTPEGDGGAKHRKGSSAHGRPGKQGPSPPVKVLAAPKFSNKHRQSEKSETKSPKLRCSRANKGSPSSAASSESGKFENKDPPACLAHRNEEENLERKKTFDIIAVENPLILQYDFPIGLANMMEETSDVNSSSTQNSQSREEKDLDFWTLSEYDTDCGKIMSVEDTEVASRRGSDTIQPKAQAKEKVFPGSAVVSETDQEDERKPSQNKTDAGQSRRQSARKEATKEDESNTKGRTVLPVGWKRPKDPIQVEDSSAQKSSTDESAREEDFSVLIQKPIIPAVTPAVSKSNTSFPSKVTYNVDSCLQPGTKIPVKSDNCLKSKHRASSTASTLSQGYPKAVEENIESPPKSQQLWEQDIRYYREIVRDIMNQYERLGGLLKQTETFDILQSGESLLEKTKREIGGTLDANSHSVSIHEYRKKVISEYTTLPTLEYKSKLQEKKKEIDEGNNKRSLTVAKPLTKETDEDVKDFQLNVQKVLDAQLYVEARERKDSHIEAKNPREMAHGHRLSQRQECSRTVSAPKAFQSLPRPPVHRSSAIQNIFLHATSPVTMLSTSEFEENDSDVAECRGSKRAVRAFL